MNIKKILAVVSSLMTVFMFVGIVNAASETVYDALPSVIPETGYTSQPFQAQQTLEFGEEIILGGTGRTLDKVTVTMVTWARHSEYLSDERYPVDSTSWTHPITLNVYGTSVDSNGEPITTLATVTQDISIPWRPENNLTDCSDGFKWKDGNGICVNGLAFNAIFDLSSPEVVLPNSVIVSVTYNTQSYGVTPIGVNGPYNSLNVAVPANQPVSVGTDVSNNEVFWNTLTASYYTLGGPAGYFRKDTNWSPYGTVAFKVEAKSVLLPPTNKDQCKNDGWMTFNNPAFANKKECEKYVKDHKKDREAEGSLQLSGPKQKIKFEVSEKDNDHDDNKVEYWNYEYPGILHYKAKAMCVNVDKTTKEARFMFQIPEGYPGLSGMYVVSYVKEVKHGTDLYGHSATADLATATAWCNTGIGFSPAMYSVNKGEVEVE